MEGGKRVHKITQKLIIYEVIFIRQTQRQVGRGLVRKEPQNIHQGIERNKFYNTTQITLIKLLKNQIPLRTYVADKAKMPQI